MKTTVTLPEPLFEAADKLAERLGVSRNWLIRHAVNQYVTAHLSDDEIRQALDKVYTNEPSELDEALAQMQWATLEKEKGSAPW